MSGENQIVAVDLFCGVGGLTHGLIKAGLDVRLGVDLRRSSSWTSSSPWSGLFF
jgi:site-specific DNA-cytosine methylase